MKMQNEHICLYYLADKLEKKQFIEYYIRLCKVLEYDQDKILSTSMILSMYNLFDGIPLTTDDIKKYNFKRSSCSTCNMLIHLYRYRIFDIANNACTLCKMSNCYSNINIDGENFILNYLMNNPDAIQEIDSPASLLFKSYQRLANDYQIGTFPIIHFNKLIFDCLKELSIKITDSNLEVLNSKISEELSLSHKDIIFDDNITNFVASYIYSISHVKLITKERFELYLNQASSDSFSTNQLLCEEEILATDVSEDAKEEESNGGCKNTPTSPDETDASKKDILAKSGFYSYDAFDPVFRDSIITVTEKNVYQFFSCFMKSKFVSAEPLLKNNIAGILFYCDSKKRFYFCDAAVCGGKMLSSYFSYNIPKILSFHPLQVMGILHSVGGEAKYLVCLNLLYGLTHEMKTCTITQMLSNLIPLESSNASCKAQIPLYAKAFQQLCDLANQQKINYDCYEEMVLLYKQLSKSVFIEGLSDTLKCSMWETSFFHFQYTYRWGMKWNYPGTIYKIGIPDLRVSDGILPKTFMALLVKAITVFPHSYSRDTKILSIEDNYIYIYYCGSRKSSEQYYDLLLMTIQTIYTNYYNKPLHNRIECHYYSK